MEEQEIKVNVPVPNGMVLIGVKSEIKDGMITIVPEYGNKPTYRIGDILVTNDGGILIYKGHSSCKAGGNAYYVGLKDDYLTIASSIPYFTYFGYHDEIRGLATEEEKQRLFGVLSKNGYKWNADKRSLEKILPRAPKDEKYFHLNSVFQIIELVEGGNNIDNQLYEAGNYFITKNDAEKYKKKIIELLKR